MRFLKNTTGRDFVVGDLHGCYDLLIEKLRVISFDEQKDRLFSVGDLIDRGPDSEKCLMLIDKPWFFAVRGNHEQMMIESVKTRDSSITSCWIMNGGVWSMNCDEDELFCFAEMADSLPWLIEVETDKGVIGILHAESSTIWQENYSHDQDAIIWGRSKIRNEDMAEIEGIDHVFVGHTPLSKPISLGNVSYIDTGAFHTGVLTLEQIQ